MLQPLLHRPARLQRSTALTPSSACTIARLSTQPMYSWGLVEQLLATGALALSGWAVWAGWVKAAERQHMKSLPEQIAA